MDYVYDEKLNIIIHEYGHAIFDFLYLNNFEKIEISKEINVVQKNYFFEIGKNYTQKEYVIYIMSLLAGSAALEIAFQKENLIDNNQIGNLGDILHCVDILFSLNKKTYIEQRNTIISIYDLTIHWFDQNWKNFYKKVKNDFNYWENNTEMNFSKFSTNVIKTDFSFDEEHYLDKIKIS